MCQRYSLVMVALLFVLLQGCVAVQTYPTIARAGDTITLALGSVDGLDKTKLQISYVPQSTGVPIDLTPNIRSVVKLYPDRTSPASMSDAWTTNLTVFSGHAMWMNIAVVDLPVSLPTGPGYYQVRFDNNVRVVDPRSITSVESVQIATEILPGTGTPSGFSYYTSRSSTLPGDFTRIEPIPQVVLRPVESSLYNFGTNHPAAVEYRIRLPISGAVSTMDDSEIHVIWDYKPGEDNKQIQLSWHRIDDVVTVNVLIPTNLTITEQQLRFSILVNPALNGNMIDIAGIPQLLSYRYFDINGSEITPLYVPEVVVMK